MLSMFKIGGGLLLLFLVLLKLMQKYNFSMYSNIRQSVEENAYSSTISISNFSI